MLRSVIGPGPELSGHVPARFASHDGGRGQRRILRHERESEGITPSQLPRRASSTFPPGRPVGVMPSLRSTSLIASRVFWPTLPSGSPTS